MATHVNWLSLKSHGSTVVSNKDRVSLKLSLQPSIHRRSPLTYLPGDNISGVVEVSSIGPLEVTDISIALEGVTRVWIPSPSVRGDTKWFEHEFLKQQGHILESFSISPDCNITHTVAFFHLEIATHLPAEGNEAEQPMPALMPPSVAEGKARFDKTGKLYMQPLIAFAVSADVSYRGLQEVAPVKNITSRFSVLMASIINFGPPPYQPQSSEGDNTSCSAWLKKKYWSRPLARVELSTHGTDPLRSSPGCYHQHVKRYLHVKWFAMDSCATKRGTTVKISIRTLLISKTCYGVRKLKLPSYDCPLLLGTNGINFGKRRETWEPANADLPLQSSGIQPTKLSVHNTSFYYYQLSRALSFLRRSLLHTLFGRIPSELWSSSKVIITIH